MTQGTVPPPPTGPGVQPPFVAPPTDGVRRRRWVAIGVAAAAAVVLCAGGVIGIGALGVFGQQMEAERSKSAVQGYLDRLVRHDYRGAYGQLCQHEQNRIEEDSFERRHQDQPIARYTLGEPDLSQSTIDVPVSVEYVDGGTDTVHYPVEVNSSTGEFEVCGDGV